MERMWNQNRKKSGKKTKKKKELSLGKIRPNLQEQKTRRERINILQREGSKNTNIKGRERKASKYIKAERETTSKDRKE